jgi:hypothetical protein
MGGIRTSRRSLLSMENVQPTLFSSQSTCRRLMTAARGTKARAAPKHRSAPSHLNLLSTQGRLMHGVAVSGNPCVYTATRIQKYKYTHTHRRIFINTHIYKYKYTDTHIHMARYSQIRTFTNTQIHIFHTYAYIPTHRHIHISTHTRIHKRTGEARRRSGASPE